MAAVLLLAVSCSDDDDSTAPEPDESTTSPRPTTTAAPDRANPEELKNEIQTLLSSYDEVLRQIVANPRVASNREDPIYDELRAFMTPDNATIDPVINALVAAGGRGERQVPEGSDLPIERQVQGDVEVVGDNQFRTLVCTHLNYRVFDNQGEPIAVVTDNVEPSNVTIVRINAQLRIEEFERLDERLCGEGNR